ncbi:MAG TPA: MmgE/PrpD family protein, partial [Lysobacter sp.]
MAHFDIRSTVRPGPDQPMVDIADYVVDYRIDSKEAFDTARYMLLDSMACAAMAMDHPECVKHLGPLVPGADMKGGARVPYTRYELDPVQAAY